ncbi:hypothetical protein NC652_021467 [Populus alba x Populus x berolinensis]|nr:hypothetical protein NC652_021467 [Populus alba x Populus x berolinensis]
MRKELSDIARDNSSEYFSAGIATGNTYDWEATVHGPPLAPYAGGVFQFGVSFPQEYPFKPPKSTASILLLLASPNPDDPLVPGIGKQYIHDRLEFEQVASIWTVKYAGLRISTKNYELWTSTSYSY